MLSPIRARAKIGVMAQGLTHGAHGVTQSSDAVLPKLDQEVLLSVSSLSLTYP